MLAAGASQRFGRDKLVAPFLGQPLLSHLLQTLRTAEQAGIIGGWRVVVREDLPERRHLIPADRAILLAATATSTPADSLRAGLAALTREPVEHALILLGDQPLMTTHALARIARIGVHSAAGVRATYADAPDAPAHPVLLPRAAWPQAGPDLLRALPRVRVRSINPDIDTPTELAALEARLRMQLSFNGSSLVHANREHAWSCLMDPRFVWAGTSGVQRLEVRGPDHYDLEVGVGVGMLRLVLTCDVRLTDLVPPASAGMQVRAAAGGMSLDLTAQVTLEATGTEATTIHWSASTEATGILATLPPRLIDTTTRALAEKFWSDLATRMSQGALPA